MSLEKLPNMIPEPTLLRLPMYHGFLKRLLATGITEISATTLAQNFNLLPILVRKDLAATGCVGIPKRGFSAHDLVVAIENILGWNRTNEAFLVGVGALGRALLTYKGFDSNGLNILAGFDSDPQIIGSEAGGKPIFPIEKLESLAGRMHVKIGIIAVPESATQSIADLLVRAGIRAIWSFSPARIRVPEHVIVQYENLANSLVLLSTALRIKLQKEVVPNG